MDDDERVRIRAQLATTTEQRGSRHRRLVASELGAGVLAEMAAAFVAVRYEHPRVATDLWWTLNGIAYDSLRPLRAAASTLTGLPRQALLRSVRAVSEAACRDLAADIAESDGPDADSLLWSVAGMFEDRTPRNEQDRAAIYASLRTVCTDAGGDVQAAAALRLLGVVAEPTSELVAELCDVLARGDTGGTVKVGACEALGKLARRATQWPDWPPSVRRARRHRLGERGPLRIAALAALCRNGETIEMAVGQIPRWKSCTPCSSRPPTRSSTSSRVPPTCVRRTSCSDRGCCPRPTLDEHSVSLLTVIARRLMAAVNVAQRGLVGWDPSMEPPWGTSPGCWRRPRR